MIKQKSSQRCKDMQKKVLQIKMKALIKIKLLKTGIFSYQHKQAKLPEH